MQGLSEHSNFLYFKSHRSLVITNKQSGKIEYDFTKLDNLNELYINECYLKHIHAYRHIALIDVDELVMPKQVERFSETGTLVDFVAESKSTPKLGDSVVFDNLKCDKRVQMDQFLPQLISKFDEKTKGSHANSLYFKQGHFLFNELIAEVFNSLENELAKRPAFDLKSKVTWCLSSLFSRMNIFL
jgi:hypothetical protein